MLKYFSVSRLTGKPVIIIVVVAIKLSFHDLYMSCSHGVDINHSGVMRNQRVLYSLFCDTLKQKVHSTLMGTLFTSIHLPLDVGDKS